MLRYCSDCAKASAASRLGLLLVNLHKCLLFTQTELGLQLSSSWLKGDGRTDSGLNIVGCGNTAWKNKASVFYNVSPKE